MRNGTTGEAVVWPMKGASVIGTALLGTMSTSWTVAGTGDFNGDGFGRVLWYNATAGQVVVWLLDGTSVIGSGSPGSAGSPWTIAGIGDFNGDGTVDILWYNTSSGQIAIWLLNGTIVIGGGSSGSVGSPWASRRIRPETLCSCAPFSAHEPSSHCLTRGTVGVGPPSARAIPSLVVRC